MCYVIPRIKMLLFAGLRKIFNLHWKPINCKLLRLCFRRWHLRRYTLIHWILILFCYWNQLLMADYSLLCRLLALLMQLMKPVNLKIDLLGYIETIFFVLIFNWRVSPKVYKQKDNVFFPFRVIQKSFVQCSISLIKFCIPDYLHLKFGSAEFLSKSSTSLRDFLSKA